ncbi:fumarate reductase iron-sulfur subunit [Ferrimonas senticii]|uniref:fumarate reductase iron-sulfur subunit n=1 Tax=Ferrimonas senticii TaxID=394566 RepID=UPI0004163BEA|nr:fumarate reductase iron-sulfur subunit [Ferrimonas senticii]
MSRTLIFEVFRLDPQAADATAWMQSFELPESAGMTVLSALRQLQQQQDPSLLFDGVCRSGNCGACAMVINGLPSLACKTLTSSISSGRITLMPLPGFELIGDLAVDTGKFMRALSMRLGAWLHPKADSRSFDQIEAAQDPHTAESIYQTDRCIECGCCVSACAAAQMRASFIGAVGMNKVARFALDDRDARGPDDFYQVLGSADGVFGCMTLLGCADACPKGLNHQMQISYLRRKLALNPNRIL